MNLENLGYLLLGLVALLWLIGMVVGMIAAWPYGLLGFAAIAGIGLLFIKVLRERLRNKEDDYYAKKIDK